MRMTLAILTVLVISALANIGAHFAGPAAFVVMWTGGWIGCLAYNEIDPFGTRRRA